MNPASLLMATITTVPQLGTRQADKVQAPLAVAVEAVGIVMQPLSRLWTRLRQVRDGQYPTASICLRFARCAVC